LYRIKDTYLSFNEQRKRGFQLFLDGTEEQTKEGNELMSFNSIATTERRVFWVGKSSKNSKQEERKHIRSVLSQISNYVSDMAINNCNRLFWLKHGSL